MTAKSPSPMSAADWRKELKELRELMAKRKGPTPDDVRVRVWIMTALQRDDQPHWQYYREHGEDLDGDIASAAPSFRPEALYEEADAAYDLKRLWRILLSHYAIRDAKRLNAVLAPMETWPWRCWRYKDLLLWRLIVALVAGHLILWSSSGLVDFVQNVYSRGAGVAVITGLSLLIVTLLAFSEVQRRIGRRPFPVIAKRTLYILGLAIFYTFVAGLAIYLVANAFPSAYGPDPRKSIVVGAIAMVLGFVFQLFWQEQSIAEPL